MSDVLSSQVSVNEEVIRETLSQNPVEITFNISKDASVSNCIGYS